MLVIDRIVATCKINIKFQKVKHIFTLSYFYKAEKAGLIQKYLNYVYNTEIIHVRYEYTNHWESTAMILHFGDIKNSDDDKTGQKPAHKNIIYKKI